MDPASPAESGSVVTSVALAAASALVLAGAPVAASMTDRVWHSGLGLVLPCLGALLAIAAVVIGTHRWRTRGLALVGGVVVAVADFAAILLITVGRWEG